MGPLAWIGLMLKKNKGLRKPSTLSLRLGLFLYYINCLMEIIPNFRSYKIVQNVLEISITNY